MSEPVSDPVHRARYAFCPEGENLIVETWLAPGGVLPPHTHPRQEERWSVLSGEVRIQLGRGKRTLRPADGEVVVPPGTRHGLSNTSDAEAHTRCRVLPALGLQAFLEESAAAAREGLFMRGGIPRSPRGVLWAARFLKRNRDEVVMAFPPVAVQRLMVALLARGERA